ncbi:hypothetical protein [Synechococcus sp. GFB01]|uniref:hypothetical protein n=1 Tax=Synechococcus sp. GFB01 TaxID=1662190 RepID=UPI000AE2B843|nr:hypothetical protein [Synechococcus sp. GFB01]
MTRTPEAPAAATSKAQLFDYRQAANPIRHGLTEPIPEGRWGPDLHARGPSAILPLDLSRELGCQGPATSPALSANFVRILAGESISAGANATSSLFYVWKGAGNCRQPATTLSREFSQDWRQGDLFVLPAGKAAELDAAEESVLYWVHDGPCSATWE